MATTIWKGHLTFGLVSIPVKLVRAARAEKIHMHRLQRGTGERVRQVFVPASEEPELPSEPEPAVEMFHGESKRPVAASSPLVSSPPFSGHVESAHVASAQAPPAHMNMPQKLHPISQPDLVSGFEFEKGRYVEFEKQQLEDLAPKASSEMQILEFVRFADVDAVYLESSYYLIPDSGGSKPYALLFQALKKSGYAAIAEFVMHRRDQTMILRPGAHGIIGHTLFYEDEVRRSDEFHADAGQANPKEIDLAMKLVEALAAPFEPGKYKDNYRERLQQAITEKIQSGAPKQATTPQKNAPVIDIMAALKQSLLQAKKPATREAKASEAPAKRSSSRKQA